MIRSPASLVLFRLAILTASCLTVITCADDELFKISKLNLVWTKAQHSLGSSKLKDLKSDLLKHEADELSLKKMKAHNQDKDGLFEAAVRKKLHSIMSKYALEKYYDDIHPNYEGKSASEKFAVHEKTNQEPDVSKHAFRDSRLDKLWKKAEKSGFSQEQLMVLHEEFQHQQERLDDHYETMNMIEEEIESRVRSENKLENSIEGSLGKTPKEKARKEKVKESIDEKKARLETNIHQTLKEKYKDIKKGIDELHKKIVDGNLLDNNGPFEFSIVNELWSAAAKLNFNPKELNSLKEELEHYETRYKKLQHFQNQLERDTISKKSDNSDGDDKENKHIRKRISDLTQKVDKIHMSIEKKLAKKRDEL